MTYKVSNVTQRFSDRVENYVRYRPSYPGTLVDSLIENIGLKPHHKIADIGAGTGIFTRLLLDQELQVTAVEPNYAMRGAADLLLGNYPEYHSVNGQSEQTGLENHSIDLITAAQAFHWFVPGKTREEFSRILTPGGHVALIWNERTLGTPFQDNYEGVLLKYGNDYASINHTNISAEDVAGFFAPGRVKEYQFDNAQTVDREGLQGRVMSASYSPKPGSPGHPAMVDALDNLFDDHAADGSVILRYITRLYLGSLELGEAH